ncbi:phage tail tube protein [Bacillus chungangensis]|uniref:Phage portal protein n=1 Tax=Bacillus chungangensis TaxID=587633 RepID=A0ABT9WRR8_9BACI|nr:phage tail tube protein [Bacillus chungangensis]MDQ0175988.1 hypothetical protein [Bacillus chungangensis]
MGFFRAKDAISGQEGKAYAIINGNVEEMFYAKKIEAKADKKKSSMKSLGHRGEQHKAAGWAGTGTMTIYYATTLFRKLMLEYIKTGKDTYFDMQVINEDPTSSIGKQTTLLKFVNLDEAFMAKLDVDSEYLDEEVSFTYEDVDILDSFGKPILG